MFFELIHSPLLLRREGEDALLKVPLFVREGIRVSFLIPEL